MSKLLPEGETIGKIIGAWFKEAYKDQGSEKRSEHSLGFVALRRSEIYRFLSDHGLQFDGMGELTKEALVPVVNGFIAQGKLDNLIKHSLDPKDAEIQDLKEKIDALTKIVHEGRVSKPEPKEIDVEKVNRAGYRDLRKWAEERDIDHKGKDAAQLRALILKGGPSAAAA